MWYGLDYLLTGVFWAAIIKVYGKIRWQYDQSRKTIPEQQHPQIVPVEEELTLEDVFGS